MRPHPGISTSLAGWRCRWPCSGPRRPCSPSTSCRVNISRWGTNIFIEILFSPGYYGYLLSAALYGLCLGCLLYTSKLYCYNSVKAKEFGHVWSMVAASQAVSALGGIMVTGQN